MLTGAGATPAVASRQAAVAEAAESAAPRFAGVLSVILPAALLVQAVASRGDYLDPVVPVLVWLGVLAAAGWLVPRACSRGLGPAEALAAIGVAVAAVAAIGADHRPAVAAVDVNWTILGTIWLLALVALSRPARVWVPGALLIFGVHAVFVVRSLGGSPLGLARVTAGGYAALIVPALFAALRPALRTHAAMAVRRAGLASRTAAERAAVTAIQDDRRDRLALLEAEALPLLSGIASGTLDPADGAVRERCARNAATLRRALVDRAEQESGVLAGLAPALDAARARGFGVQVQVVGDPGRPGPAVTRATLGAVHEVLRSLPGQPVTLTILAVGGNVELYLTFGQAPAGRWDLAGWQRDVPPEAGWAATADAGDGGPGCLEIRWRIEEGPR